MTDDQPASFDDRDLRGARFTRCDLSQAVMRGVIVNGAEIESPWLMEGGATLFVNGIDVAPLVDAELNRRFPGRELRTADSPDGLRAAWDALESAWSAMLARVATLPDDVVDISVAGEWSFEQTLRHLVMAIDTWLVRAILDVEQPYHPIGQPHAEYETDGYDLSIFVTEQPSFGEVLDVWAGRQAMVRDFLAGVTAAQLAEEHPSPWAPQYRETTLSCLHTILEEEWEHLRYAIRDLDAIEAASGA